jgi:transcriptional regulator with XRE-family HTH domain
MDRNDDPAHRRLRVLELAESLGNVSEACRRGGMPRSRFYELRRRFRVQGIEGLHDRPQPQATHPKKTTAEAVDRVLGLSFAHPEWGCGRLSAQLREQGVRISPPTVQNILARNGLGTLANRLQALELRRANRELVLTAEQAALVAQARRALADQRPAAEGPETTDEAVPDRLRTGWLIRYLRRTRRQPHNGRPWTQEDLAVAVGTDASHVSRIEREEVLPSRATLARISDALGVTAAQRDLLLQLSGYAPEADPPTDAEIRAAIESADALVRDYAYPVTLITAQLRLVYVNPAYLRLYRLTRERFDAEMRWRTIPEIYLAMKTSDLLHGFLREDLRFEVEATRRWLELLRVVWEVSPGHELAGTVLPLLQIETFRAWWQQAGLDLVAGRISLAAAEHFPWSYSHPELGHLTFHRWFTALPSDRRLSLRHDVPADRRTNDALRALDAEDNPVHSDATRSMTVDCPGAT